MSETIKPSFSLENIWENILYLKNGIQDETKKGLWYIIKKKIPTKKDPTTEEIIQINSIYEANNKHQYCRLLFGQTLLNHIKSEDDDFCSKIFTGDYSKFKITNKRVGFFTKILQANISNINYTAKDLENSLDFSLTQLSDINCTLNKDDIKQQLVEQTVAFLNIYVTKIDDEISKALLNKANIKPGAQIDTESRIISQNVFSFIVALVYYAFILFVDAFVSCFSEYGGAYFHKETDREYECLTPQGELGISEEGKKIIDIEKKQKCIGVQYKYRKRTISVTGQIIELKAQLKEYINEINTDKPRSVTDRRGNEKADDQTSRAAEDARSQKSEKIEDTEKCNEILLLKRIIDALKKAVQGAYEDMKNAREFSMEYCEAIEKYNTFDADLKRHELILNKLEKSNSEVLERAK